MRVLVALSGGVDSAVAAARLLEAGHQVAGVTLVQSCRPVGAPGCCADVGDAAGVARQLGISHRTLDYTELFRREVIEPFVAAYEAGLTPNPCLACNREVRFGALLAEAARGGFDLLATGHHARIRRRAEGFCLLRGADPAKDQSYVLYMLGQGQLARLAFPVGELNKSEVRGRARALGLAAAERPESQDLCFVGPEGYRAFLEEWRYPQPARPGPVVDTAGRRLGEHRGVAGFTIGQRRGLGVAAGEARYVVELRPETATVVVGGVGELTAAGCRVGDPSWVWGPPADGEAEVKVRYRSPAVPARIAPGEAGEWLVHFALPVAAVTPGQAAVVYRGDEVLGGGTIRGTLRA